MAKFLQGLFRCWKRKNEIKVKIKLLEGATMPSYAKEGDAGADLYPLYDIEIAPNATGVIIPTGVCMEIPKKYEGQVRPKSGNSSKTPIRVILGTVDNGYRGEVGIIIDNLSDEVIKISKDKALAQVVFNEVPRAIFEVVDELSETERGTGGFGSTGRGI